MDLAGIHHVTAITARIRDNHRFYTGVLGMRLVKRSVNQDDVRAYHLFYADAVGTRGQISPSLIGSSRRKIGARRASFGRTCG